MKKTPDPFLTAAGVKAKALELGFDACGIAPAADHPELRFFPEWLARGWAGKMTYLHRSAKKRADVRRVLPSARSVIVTGTVYNTDRPYSTALGDPALAQIARYAWGDDYHAVVGARLGALVTWMRDVHGAPFESWAYVDTGPVQERVYARHAGLGWIGKNSCLINPALGSWLFLAEVICSVALDPDPPAFDQCGTCTLCLEACPTGALVGAGQLDATRCISYLTIELKQRMPPAQRTEIGTHVYGCDICQEVCPWNAMAPRSDDPAWAPRPALDLPRLVDLWRRTDEETSRLLDGSAMRRVSLPAWRRNLAVALANSHMPEALDALEHPPPDSPSVGTAMVREHIAWAVEEVRRQRPVAGNRTAEAGGPQVD